MRPVTAITAFLPTEDCQNTASRFIGSRASPVYHRLHPSHRLGGSVQVRPLLIGEGDLEDPVETLSPEETGHPAEDVPQAELTLQPGGARQQPPTVERDGLDHLDRG